MSTISAPKLKRIVLCAIPTSICNFRCHYCYLTHRDVAFQGEQARFEYSPEHVAKAFSVERLGGVCYFNFCADGETLLTKKIDEYIKGIVEQGHFAEIVSNMMITPMLDKILSWDKELLKRVEFKCSFHWLELKKRNLLQVFADNVNAVWAAGASASVEVTPSDELIPYIEEVKAFSLEHFGAYPQCTIARNDATRNIEYLTKLPTDEYIKAFSAFESPFFEFKTGIFGEIRHEYCMAGVTVLAVNLATGLCGQCYRSNFTQNIFKDLSKPIKYVPIGKCRLPHCYNGHALLTLGAGAMPQRYKNFYATNIRAPEIRQPVIYYGDLRDRTRADGSHWLQPELLALFNQRADEHNTALTRVEKKLYYGVNTAAKITRIIRYPYAVVRKVRSLIRKK
ncbi:MAG: radical SAM protein [Candidatus Pelethousia sp.]|nr:radical SAM protein [Candidatus Pelethousia sp.]